MKNKFVKILLVTASILFIHSMGISQTAQSHTILSMTLGKNKGVLFENGAIIVPVVSTNDYLWAYNKRGVEWRRYSDEKKRKQYPWDTYPSKKWGSVYTFQNKSDKKDLQVYNISMDETKNLFLVIYKENGAFVKEYNLGVEFLKENNLQNYIVPNDMGFLVTSKFKRIVQFDLQGNKQWEYEVPEEYELKDIEWFEEKLYILETNESKANQVLARISIRDTKGNAIDVKPLELGNKIERISHLEIGKKGDFYIGGEYFPNKENNYDIAVARVSKDFKKVEWKLYLDEKDNQHLLSMKFDGNRRYLNFIYRNKEQKIHVFALDWNYGSVMFHENINRPIWQVNSMVSVGNFVIFVSRVQKIGVGNQGYRIDALGQVYPARLGAPPFGNGYYEKNDSQFWYGTELKPIE